MKISNKLKMFSAGIAALLSFSVMSPALADPPARVSKGVMLQGFGWDCKYGGDKGNWYRNIEGKADDIKALGIDFVWFPPVTRSVSDQGYLPCEYYDVGTPSNPTFYGDENSLVSCLQTLNEKGIIPVADIVINHRCASHQDKNGIWNIYNFASGKAVWDNSAICSGQFGGTGKPDTGESFPPAPDLDHNNKQVREDIVEWMNWLKKFGFKAWRYDYVKGYSSKFNGYYDKNTSPLFSVGELWTNMAFTCFTLNNNQDAHRQKLCDWLDKNPSDVACLFDFTTKGLLQVAVKGEYWRLRDKEGKPAGLIGWWPARAVTFLDNHDTGSKQAHWPFPGEDIMQGYAYILTHPGIPCVFWEHVYDWKLKNEIKKLISIRKACRINSTSKVEILRAEDGLYAAVIDGRVAMKLGTKDWCPEDDTFKLATSGKDYAVWAKPVKKMARSASTKVSNTSRSVKASKNAKAKKASASKKKASKKKAA